MTSASFGQDYKVKFKTDICVCFEEEISTNIRNSDTAYETCFNKALINYASLIDADIADDNPSVKYQKGQKIRLQLKKDFRQELIYSCDTFYNTVESERKRMLNKGRAKAYTSDLETLNQNVALHPTSNSYFQRGIKHFMLENLKEAEADLRKSIEINPSTTRNIYSKKGHVLLAWILEEQGRLNEALEVLNKIEISNYDKELPLLIAVVHRKSGGVELEPFNQKSSTKSIKKQETRQSRKIESKTSPIKKTNKSELRSLFKLDKNKKDTTKLKTRKRPSRGNG